MWRCTTCVLLGLLLASSSPGQEVQPPATQEAQEQETSKRPQPGWIEPLARVERPEELGGVLAVCISDDGRVILAVDESDDTYALRVIDAETGKITSTLLEHSPEGFVQGFPRLEGTAAGTVLMFTADAKQVHVLTQAGEARGTLDGRFGSTALSADGKRLFAAVGPTLETWNLEEAKLETSVQVADLNQSTRFVPVCGNDAGLVVAFIADPGEDGTMPAVLIDPKDGSVKQRSSTPRGAVAADPAGGRFAVIELDGMTWKRVGVYSAADLTPGENCTVPGQFTSTSIHLLRGQDRLLVVGWMVELGVLFDLDGEEVEIDGILGPESNLVSRIGVSPGVERLVTFGGRAKDGAFEETHFSIFSADAGRTE